MTYEGARRWLAEIGGTWEVATTCDAVVQLPGDSCMIQRQRGSWSRLRRTGNGFAIQLDSIPDGATLLSPDKGTKE